MLALWALLLLSLIVFTWTKFIQKGLGAAGEATLALEARALAHSGAAVALHPDVSATDAYLLSAQQDSQHSYKATIESEGARINLNFVLANEDPVRLQLLKNYLAMRGLKPAQQDTLVDCLLDWVGPAGGPHHLNGATDQPGYHPPHRPLQALDELYSIKGTGPLTANPKWKDDFTIYSSGPLDLESVSAELLGLVPGVGPQAASRFVEIRQGPDHIDHTPDDHSFSGLGECLSVMGLSQQQAQIVQASGLLGFHDPMVRIHSVGTASKYRKVLDVVAQKSGGNPVIFQWTEK